MKITEHETINSLGETVITVCVDDENGHLTWISKSVWDEQQAKQETLGGN